MKLIVRHFFIVLTFSLLNLSYAQNADGSFDIELRGAFSISSEEVVDTLVLSEEWSSSIEQATNNKPSMQISKKAAHKEEAPIVSQSDVSKQSSFLFNIKLKPLWPGQKFNFIISDKDYRFGTHIFFTIPEDGTVNLGQINLNPMGRVKGKITYTEEKARIDRRNFDEAEVIFAPQGSYFGNVVAKIDPETKRFSAQLPPGTYTMYISAMFSQNNLQSNIENVEISPNKSMNMGRVDIDNHLDSLVNQLTLTDMLKTMRFSPSSHNESGVDYANKDRIETELLGNTNRHVVLYFTYCSCTPCFGDPSMLDAETLAKNPRSCLDSFQFAGLNHEKLALMFVHSDFTENKKCPQSILDLEHILNGSNINPERELSEKSMLLWNDLNQSFLSNNNYNNLFITWQKPQVAKNLDLPTYPGILVFSPIKHKGKIQHVLSDWDLGWTSKILDRLLSDSE